MNTYVTDLFWQLETGTPQHQASASEALAQIAFQLHAHSSNLIRQLNHTRAPIRRQAACTLGTLRCREAVDALLNRAAHDRDDEVRLEALHALGQIRDRLAVEPLTRLLMHRTTPSEPIRAAIVAALGAIGDERAMIPLLAQLTETNAHIRQVTIQAISMVLEEKSSAGLWRGLEPEESPRAKVLSFLLSAPMPNANPMIDRMRQDDGDVCLEDVTFFAEMDARTRTRLLLAGLHSDVPTDARIMVLQLVAAVNDRSAVPGVCAALQDRESAVRKQALKTLAHLGDRRAVAPILALAQRERWNDVLLEAVIALAHLGDRHAVPLLQELLHETEHSPHDELRFAVWLAIERLCAPADDVV